MNDVMRLSEEEMRFFKREGYIIKRGVMDPELMARARDCFWGHCPLSIRRDDPSTWIGPVKEEEVVEDDDGFSAKNYRLHDFKMGREDWVIEMLATNPNVFGMVEQLLGVGRVDVPEIIRGIYCTMPYGDRPLPPPDCHNDMHTFQVGCVGYIDDVGPNGGGFQVWPGSHRVMYYEYESQYLHQPTDTRDATVKRISEGDSVDCHGSAGDVVFWHQRLGHMAGHNYSDRIRQAALYDFCSKELGDRWRKDPPLPPAPIMLEPPNEDMWKDWSPELRALEI